ncbi:9510_t:CDS:2 [Paraglomus occultum]|uniref:9510_t:CDS:1 n=1 Tax=Paraglomus occultum TaxID=144539 RepID=A0A9N9B368_9GLOM|nr:9510_t:CDS:2 [Paraglomus occultum]
MKFNLAVIFLLATLCVAVFATPVPEAAEVESLQKKRQRLRKLKRDTKALRKLNKRAAAAAVATDPNVFNQNTLSGPPNPNICNQSKLTKGNGTQDKTPGPGGRTCVTTQLGELPDVTNMPSSFIVSPQNGARIPANQPFTVSLKMSGIELGNFDNPDNQYYSFAQQLNKQGQIKGHSHITIQSLDGANPPNAQLFDFFKGLNNPPVNGVLSVSVANGLATKGLKRICSMSSSFAHTPVIMPVAQRGSQDDCIRVFIV